jgi:hypothetical protein
MTDPDSTTILFLLAPMNAIIYAAIGTALYAAMKEAKHEINQFRQR